MVIAIAVLAILYSLYVAFSLSPTELQIAVRYTAYGETHLYRNKWYYLVSFVIVAVLVSVAHSGLMVKLKARGVRPMALALGWLTIIIISVLFIVTQRVLSSAYLS
jgi:hypothetical protein